MYKNTLNGIENQLKGNSIKYVEFCAIIKFIENKNWRGIKKSLLKYCTKCKL